MLQINQFGENCHWKIFKSSKKAEVFSVFEEGKMNESIELGRKASVFKYFAIIHENAKPRLLVCQYDYEKKNLTRKPFGNVNQFMSRYS